MLSCSITKPPPLQPVEEQRRVLAGVHPHREFGIVGVGEAMHGGHVEHARRKLRRDVEYPSPADGRELRPIPYKRNACAGLARDGEKGKGGVLVKHPRLVDHDPLAAHEARPRGGASVRRAGLGISVTGVETSPYAVVVPPPPVLM